MDEKKKHKHGYKVPENYFQDMEESLFSKMAEEQLPANTGFDTPDGYFDKLEDRIMQNLQQSKPEPRVISIFSNKQYVYGMSIAASVVLLLALFFNDSNKVKSIDDLQISSIESYLEESMDWDSYDIAALAEEGDFTNATFENEILTDESLEDYLLDNLDESTLLIEQE